MIDDRFYKGFEGEAAVSFVTDTTTLMIWNGYFETIMHTLLDYPVEKKGILKEFFNYEGWYEDSPWIIEDISLTIHQLKLFECRKGSREALEIASEEVVTAILMFLEENQRNTVAIDYD